MRPVWVEVDLEAIYRNFTEVRKLIRPGTQIMAVIKANAYGHGAVEVANKLCQAGATCFGVATQQEALELRQSGIRLPILILGFTPLEDAELTVEHGITQTIFSFSQGEALSRAAVKLGRKAAVHIKIDTGMGRIGMPPHEETMKVIAQLMKLPGLEVEGIFTHLAQADAPDKSSALQQTLQFSNFVQQLEANGISIPLKHVANSAATIELPQTHLNLVRPGIMLYGLSPSAAIKQGQLNLRPALTWKTKIVHLKEVPQGTSISYGGTYITNKTAKIATLPLGYADGLMRVLSNRGEVLVKGYRAPIVGRVCMDQTMIDVTGIPQVAVGDLVTIIGKQGQEEITADELAEKAGTINYEVVCSISSRVLRKYVP